MAILDRETLARILALPGFDASVGTRSMLGARHGLTELPLGDTIEHDGWQAVRPRDDDRLASPKEWWSS